MNCPSCNHDNRPGAKFCEACAAPLKRACAGCGSELRPTAKFCDECGAKSDSAARPAPPPRETPKHLADKIRQSKAAVEGERKQVTVLFADVKGSMELAESLDPEAFSRIMSRFFAILTEGVERFEGFVDKFTGDGIMALFGAPIAHEDHAQRACYAALHLRDEIARYATELKREHGLSFSTRMGLNSGEVVVGTIGDDLRMDYTAQGHTVGLAQRMENLAEPNLSHAPSGWWIVGLGHLGQAYSWVISWLDYSDPTLVSIVLQDTDGTVPANHSTGVLTPKESSGRPKTRLVSEALEKMEAE